MYKYLFTCEQASLDLFKLKHYCGEANEEPIVIFIGKAIRPSILVTELIFKAGLMLFSFLTR